MKDFLLPLADRHDLTFTEQERREIHRLLHASSRKERLEELTRQVISGKYRVNPRGAADGVIDDGLESYLVHLAESLKLIPPGSRDWRLFEKTCSLVIRAVFDAELGRFKNQHKVEPNCRVDLFGYNQAESGFWRDMKFCHGLSHVVFEIKNKDSLSKDDERQLFEYARPFRAVVAVTKKPNPPSLYQEMAKKLLLEKKFVLPISTSDVKTAADFAAKGKLASAALIPRYEQLVAALP